VTASRPTPRQTEVLAAIASLTKAKGYPPTLRELGEALGIRSTNGVNDHLDALERKGLIARDSNVARSVRVVRPC
jgi:repressor LexA